MYILNHPDAGLLESALCRPQLKEADLERTIKAVFERVSNEGDAALRAYTQEFDQVEVTTFRVPDEAFDAAEKQLSESLKSAIRIAASNIAMFHESQRDPVRTIETSPGVTCWRRSVPVENVGLYIPGGTAPLFSTVLMLGIPARIAGCRQRIVCTPPARDGSVHPAILFAAKVAGITDVFTVGGAQAIAAMTLGTESIPKADKLFGPGNQYVTAAKRYAQNKGTGIDLPAGPSEVLVAADASVPAGFVAADLVAQAEHGSDSQVVLLTETEDFARAVNSEIDKQLIGLPRAAIVRSALKNSPAIVVSMDQWGSIINRYAPEHLIVAGAYEERVEQEVAHAGSVFLGKYTAESFGDYASGTNHTLPTAGFARAYSGVSLDSFVKKITYQRVEPNGLQTLGPVVMELAAAEELQAHANAIRVRLTHLTNAI